MPTTLEDKLAALPPERRAGIERRGKAIADRDRALARLRQLRKQSQQQLAEKLGVQQAAVSKLEKKADLYVSTLRRYVEAAGGRLEIVARFPDGPPVRLRQFGSLASAGAEAEPSAEEPRGPDPLAPGGPIA